MACKSKEIGRGVAGTGQGQDRVHALTYGLPDDEVQVAVLQQVLGMLVIGNEKAAAGKGFPKQGQQSLQILGGSAFPDHDPLPQADLFHGLLRCGTFMIAGDAAGHIGGEGVSAEARPMSVHPLAAGLGGLDLCQHIRIAPQDTWEVHHFRQPQHPGVVQVGGNVPGGKDRAAFIVTGGGYTTGCHEPDIHREPLGGLKHVLDPIQTRAAGMNPEGLKKDYGHFITFCGALDEELLLRHGTPDKVREGVKELLDVMAPGGGFILGPSHKIKVETPIENVLAMYEAAREWHY